LVLWEIQLQTDDHLRNHGFLYERHKGWRLSPAFDLNPTPIDIKPRILTTAIDFEDHSASLETALNVAGEFKLSKSEAKQIIEEVAQAIKNWQTVASNLWISKQEIKRMSSAFEY
jgi:serine/threonine-protein kinase HipA